MYIVVRGSAEHAKYLDEIGKAIVWAVEPTDQDTTSDAA